MALVKDSSSKFVDRKSTASPSGGSPIDPDGKGELFVLIDGDGRKDSPDRSPPPVEGYVLCTWAGCGPSATAADDDSRDSPDRLRLGNASPVRDALGTASEFVWAEDLD